LKAGAKIEAGDVVAFEVEKTGTVVPATATTKSIAGVALYGARAEQMVAVAGPGSVVKVRVAATKTVNAGELAFAVGADGTAGQVGTLDTKTRGGWAVGIAAEKIVAGEAAAEGYVVVLPQYVGKEAAEA
jgi:hypothetical protein